MVDLQETPAVPPTDYGGDERLGFVMGGALLILLGWGFGIILNLVLHHFAGTGGLAIGPIVITSELGWYAWAVLGFGAATGVVGVLMLYLARRQPRGRFVLPGYPY